MVARKTPHNTERIRKASHSRRLTNTIIDDKLAEANKRIQAAALNGEYECLIHKATLTKQMIIRLRTLGYDVITQNKIKNSDYWEVGWHGGNGYEPW